MSFGQVALAIGMIAWGVLNLITRDFASPWQAVPTWVPAHAALACACGVVMVLGGIGLLIKRTAAWSAQVLFWYTLLWLVLLKTPALFTAPQVEQNWLGWGEIALLVAGAATLAATNDTQLRAVRYLVGFSLIPIGLSHFVYLQGASTMVPAVLPYRRVWTIFTGSAHIAAGLGILFGVYARLATILEAGMISAFTLFVWVIPMLAAPGHVALWVPVIVSLAEGNAVFAVASKMR